MATIRRKGKNWQAIIRKAEDIQRHLEWWKNKLGDYALQVLTPDMIARKRQELATGTTSKGTKRAPSTVKRKIRWAD